MLRLGGGTALGNPVSSASARLTGDVDIAGQASQHGGASLIQCGGVAQQIDKVGRVKLGGDEVAASSSGAHVEIAGHHIHGDGDAAGRTAELGGCSFRSFNLKTSGLACCAVGGVGEIVDGAEEGEAAGFFFAQADFGGLHGHRLFFDVELFEHSSAGLIDRTTRLDELTAQIFHAVLVAQAGYFSDAGALSLNGLGPHHFQVRGGVFHFRNGWCGYCCRGSGFGFGLF